MKRFAILVVFLGACNTPSVDQWGGQSSAQSVGAFTFTVHHRSDRAEAYRTNLAWRMNRATVFEAAARAMEQASGCKAVRGSLAGDVALIKADLIC